MTFEEMMSQIKADVVLELARRARCAVSEAPAAPERIRTAPPQEDTERAQQLHRIEQRFFSSVMRAVHSASDLHFKGGVLAAINERREAIAGLPPLTGPKVIPSTPSSAPPFVTNASRTIEDERDRQTDEAERMLRGEPSSAPTTLCDKRFPLVTAPHKISGGVVQMPCELPVGHEPPCGLERGASSAPTTEEKP